MKFQDKFYDIIDHIKYPSSDKSAAKGILRISYFHHSEPIYICILWCGANDSNCTGPGPSVTTASVVTSGAGAGAGHPVVVGVASLPALPAASILSSRRFCDNVALGRH